MDLSEYEALPPPLHLMTEVDPVSEMGIKEKLDTIDSVQNSVYCNHDQKRSDTDSR
jgi:hypothetical protein